MRWRTTISGDIHSRPHMHSPPWLTTAWHWFAGSSPDLRRHVLFCLGSLQLYLVSLGVLWHGVYLGLMPREVAQQISIPIVCTWGTAFLLIRSGWSRRCADPVLTLPHAMASTLVTVLAYLLIGEYRGDVLVLLAQTIAVTMFRISPKQSLFLGCWAVGCLSVAQLGLALGLFGQVDPVLIGAHFVVSTSSLLALALVAKWVSDIRLKITRQARKLEETLAQVQSMATTDMLTGLLNRRQMEEVLEARRKGRGRHIDVSMTHGLHAHLVMPKATGSLMAPLLGRQPGPGEDLLNGALPCYNLYPCLDGRTLAVGALEHKFWTLTCGVFERPDWLAQHWQRGQMPNSPECKALRSAVAALVASQPLAHWLEKFHDVDACVTPVLTVQEAQAHELFHGTVPQAWSNVN